MIDVDFDFTTDTPSYWDGFWGRNDGLGAGSYDPDTWSKTLQKYHQILWSRKLPNGETMDLVVGSGAKYLTWKGFRFGSDSIIASFRYKKYRCMIDQVRHTVPDYEKFMEDFLRQSYTIGGMIIFPKRRYGSINQDRGCNTCISDRWDLTLECIRKFYLGEPSPLYETLLREKGFFDLFVDFRGYVDFFFLQDCVSADYQTVRFWLGNGMFTENPRPDTVEDYLLWIEECRRFLEKRNNRIKAFCITKLQ